MKSPPQKKYLCTFLVLLAMTFAFYGAHFLYNSGLVIILSDQQTPQSPQNPPGVDVEPPSDQALTLLITHGRSGSTFTSHIIAHHRHVFYTFEPLSFLSRLEEAFRVPIQLQTVGLKDFSQRVIESFLTCRFDLETLTSLGNKHLGNSDSTKHFYSCFTQKGTTGIEHFDCYFDFVRNCTQHFMKLVKTIRFPVKWAGELMIKYPRLKIIYLIRDPRATLFSQALVLKRFKLPKDITKASAIHCHWLTEDLDHLLKLRDRFPGRVKVVRYEHGATDPSGYAREIYRFLGLPVTTSLMEYVHQLTSPQKKHSKDKDGTRRSSKEGDKELSDSNSTAESASRINRSKTKDEMQAKFRENSESVQEHLYRFVNSQNKTDYLFDQKRFGIVPLLEQPGPNFRSQRDQTSKRVRLKRSIVHQPQTKHQDHSSKVTIAPQTTDSQTTQAVSNRSMSRTKSNTMAGSGPAANETLKEPSSGQISVETKLVHKKRRKIVKYVYPYSTHRDDPRWAMNHWRYRLGLRMTRVVDTYCGHLYPRLGYRRVTSQRDLENTARVSLVTKPLLDGLR